MPFLLPYPTVCDARFLVFQPLLRSPALLLVPSPLCFKILSGLLQKRIPVTLVRVLGLFATETCFLGLAPWQIFPGQEMGPLPSVRVAGSLLLSFPPFPQ